MIPPVDRQARAAAALRRTDVWARVSGGSLVLLGAVSLAISIAHPLSAGFLISVAVIVSGFVEWRLAGRLKLRDMRAPGRLALNQVFLGAAITAYAAWQASTLQPEAVEALLARPAVRSVLQLAEPGTLRILVDVLPEVVRMLYAVVGAAAVLGCGLTALFYRSRHKHLVTLSELAAPPPLP